MLTEHFKKINERFHIQWLMIIFYHENHTESCNEFVLYFKLYWGLLLSKYVQGILQCIAIDYEH